MMFKSRTEAGKLLADKLRGMQLPADAVVLALPRGGLPVGVYIFFLLLFMLYDILFCLSSRMYITNYYNVIAALEVARALHAPLDVLLVRKIGAPQQRELAIAAIVEGPSPEAQIVIDKETFELTGATHAYLEQQAKQEMREIERRRVLYLKGRSSLSVTGRHVILVGTYSLFSLLLLAFMY